MHRVLLVMLVGVALAPGAARSAPASAAERLLAAADAGRVEEVRRLLQAGADPNAADAGGVSALMKASAGGHAQVVRVLLERKAAVDAVDRNGGRTALHLAAQKGSDEVVTVLLAAGANPDLEDGSGQTPLVVAMSASQHRIAKKLVRAGAGVQRKLNGEALVAAAVKAGRADLVDLMLHHGGDPSARLTASNVSTLPAAAVFYGKASTDTLEVLASHRAGLDDKTQGGSTPLLLAAEQGKLHFVRFLVEHGANLNATSGKQGILDMPGSLLEGDATRDYVLEHYGDKLPAAVRTAHELLRAVRRNDVADVTRRLDAKIDLAFPVGEYGVALGSVALQEAAARGHLELVKLLLARRVKPTMGENIHGYLDAAGLAAQYDRWDVVQALLEAGAPATSQASGPLCTEARTLIGVAAAKGRLDMVRLLWGRGARFEPPTGELPGILGCVLRGDPEMVRFVLDAKVDPNRKYNPGYDAGLTTPFFEAVKWAPLPVVQLLVERGGDLKQVLTWNIDEENGKRRKVRVGAADAAALQGRYDVLAFLSERGVPVDASRAAEVRLWRAAFTGDQEAVAKALPAVKAPALRGQAVIAAAMGNRPGVVRQLVAAGVPVDVRREAQKSALMTAMDLGNVEAAAALLELGADLRAPLASWDSSTAVTFGARSPRRKEVVALLRAHGLTPAGELAAELAAACAAEGDVDCLKELAEEGLDLAAWTPKGRSALWSAVSWSRAGAVRFLLEHGVKPDREGYLVSAMVGMDYTSNQRPPEDDVIETAKLLLEAGVSLEEENRFGETPLFKVVEAVRPHPRLMELLREKGANRCHRRLAGQDALAAAADLRAGNIYWLETPGWSCKSLVDLLKDRPWRRPNPERLAAAGAEALAAPLEARVMGAGQVLRAEPRGAADKVATLDAGTRGVILARARETATEAGLSGHWLLWDDGVRRGWVFSPFIGVVEGETDGAWTARPFEDERVSFELGIDKDGARCRVRLGEKSYRPDAAFGDLEEGELPVSSSIVLAGLGSDAALDPICVLRSRDTVQLCPMPWARDRGSLRSAPCLRLDGDAPPAVSVREVGGKRMLEVTTPQQKLVVPVAAGAAGAGGAKPPAGKPP